MTAWAEATFASLRTPNYRRYFAGQGVSLVGTWMQTVAQAWLVLQLTGSGTALGLVAAAQFLPILLLAPYGGLLADRLDRRAILIATQSALGAMALTLGLLTVTGAVRLWMVVALALALGVATAIDNPARQAFAQEMVGPDGLLNAVSLNSVMVNTARALGPAVAGVLIATVGTGPCFLINAASYAAVVAALAGMDERVLIPAPHLDRAPGQVRQGLRYVARTPDLLVPLMMLALVGTLAYEFQVVLPLMARGPFEGGAGTYGLLSSAMGAGAIVGGLVVAGHGRTGLRPLSAAAAVFGLAILGAAAAPSVATSLVALAVVGAASVAFLSAGNSTLQLVAEPPFRGRVMALWAVAFLGSTPLGAPIVGAVSEHVSPRAGLALGGLACLAAGRGNSQHAKRRKRRGCNGQAFTRRGAPWSNSCNRPAWAHARMSKEERPMARTTPSRVRIRRLGAVTAIGVLSLGGGGAAIAATSHGGTGTAFTCDGKLATQVGTDTGETINGTAGDDVIVALGGDDTVNGLAGNDTICLGAGDDSANGGAGNDVILGEDGNDNANGAEDADRVDGGAGTDRLVGSTGDDTLLGGVGDDRLDGGAGKDVADGQDGNDLVLGGAGNDGRLKGGAGIDTVRGDAGRDTILGGPGRDTLDGGAAKDTIYGQVGADTITGGPAADKIVGGPGADTIDGGGDGDRIRGGADNDTIRGGAGPDFLFGEGGNDHLDGGAGRDRANGGRGSDTCTTSEIQKSCES